MTKWEHPRPSLVSGHKEESFNVTSGYLWAVCFTSSAEGIAVFEGSNIVNVYKHGTREKDSLYLPPGKGKCSITRRGDTLVVADNSSDSLYLLDNDNKLVKSIKLSFTPWYISYDGMKVFLYSKIDEQLYTLSTEEIESHGKVQPQKLTLENRGSLHNIHVAASKERVALCYKKYHKVHVYSQQGELLFVYGSEVGCEDGQLNVPRDVCFDEDNNLYIADFENSRVVVLTPDGTCAGYVHVGDKPLRLDVSNKRLCVGCYGRTVNVYRLIWH